MCIFSRGRKWMRWAWRVWDTHGEIASASMRLVAAAAIFAGMDLSPNTFVKVLRMLWVFSESF